MSMMHRVALEDGKSTWECVQCGKQHHNKSNILQHVDLHIAGVQYINDNVQYLNINDSIFAIVIIKDYILFSNI